MANLLGDPQGMVTQGNPVAQDGDLNPVSAAGQQGGNDIGGGHGAVGVLVVLVDTHPVKSQFLGVLQLIEVTVVEQMALLWIVVTVRERHPG